MPRHRLTYENRARSVDFGPIRHDMQAETTSPLASETSRQRRRSRLLSNGSVVSAAAAGIPSYGNHNISLVNFTHHYYLIILLIFVYTFSGVSRCAQKQRSDGALDQSHHWRRLFSNARRFPQRRMGDGYSRYHHHWHVRVEHDVIHSEC